MTRVIGREPELAEGERFLDAIRAGLAALVLTGEAGAGKTTIWAELAMQGARRSYRLLSCRPAEFETRLSLGSISDLLADVEDEAYASLPGAQRHALEVALLRADAGERPPDRRAVATGFLSLISELTRDGPVVIAVDDVQWLDRSSARVLEFAARRLHGWPVGILSSVRGSDEIATPLGLDRALSEEQLWRLCVGALPLADLHELISSRLGQRFPRSTLARIHAAVGGNPFFALEIARALLLRGAPGPEEALRLPENLQEVVNDRIRRLPAATREALLFASATPEPTTELIAAALGSDEPLAAAEQGGVVENEAGRLRFTHPLLASGIYAAATTSDRRRAHAQLGGLAKDLEERARQLALASDSHDEDVAQALEEAAVEARARGGA